MAMIHELIGKAMKEVGAIGKNSKNQQQGFMYRGIDAVYNALNPVMSKYGMFITPEIVEQHREERTTKNGASITYTILTIKYTVYAPDGSNISMTVIGEGMDSGDKSANKAMSTGMKYAMFQLFFIPTEELKDPDADVYDDIAPKTAPAKTVKKDPPAVVEQAKKLPQATPVQAYLNNEIAFMAQRLEISDKAEMGKKFVDMRSALVKGKVIEDIPSEKLTMEQAQKMIDAMYATFFTDGGAA